MMKEESKGRGRGEGGENKIVFLYVQAALVKSVP